MRAILPEIGTRKHGILQGVPWMTHHQIIPDELFADRSIHGTPTKLRKVKEAYDLNTPPPVRDFSERIYNLKVPYI